MTRKCGVRGAECGAGLKILTIVILLLTAYCFLLTPPAYPVGSLLFYPKFRAFDTDGNPLSGGLLYTYAPGTTTNKATYSDRILATPNANPVVLDSNGEATIYLDGLTKVVLKTSADVTLWTMDNVSSEGSFSYSGAAGTIAVFTGASGVSGYDHLSGTSISPDSMPSNRMSDMDTTRRISSTTYNLGMIQVVEVSDAGPTQLSGVSGQWFTGVSIASRSKTSGVSVTLKSPTGNGENALFFLKHHTSNEAFGTTTYVCFTQGDKVDGPDNIVAGTSKYVLSGVTDAQKIFVVSNEVSKWIVQTSGSPSVVKQ